MKPRPWSLGSLLAVGLGASGCTAAPVAATPVSSTPQAAAPQPSGLATGFAPIEVTGQGLELSLPDAAGWRHDPRERASWVGRHAGTHSLLVARTWTADEIVRVPDCERQMRLWRPDLPQVAPAERVESRELRLDGGYAARLEAGVQMPAVAGADSATGQLLLFGSDGRHCLCLAFSTAAEGAGAPRLVGERLGIMSRLVFERVRRLDIGARLSVPRR